MSLLGVHDNHFVSQLEIKVGEDLSDPLEPGTKVCQFLQFGVFLNVTFICIYMHRTQKKSFVKIQAP